MKQIVLDDELAEAYFNFKNGCEVNKNLIERLFLYYKPFQTNKSQLDRIGRASDSSRVSQLVGSGFNSQSIEDLCKETSLKLILNRKKNYYPYVNINEGQDNIESNYTGTFLGVSKDKCKAHLKELCSNAETIFIKDKYFSRIANNAEKVFDLFPSKKTIIIYYLGDDINQNIKIDWESKNSNIQIKKEQNNRSYSKYHDRYMIINQKVQIILTSGFDNLFRNDGDFSYIVRELN